MDFITQNLLGAVAGHAVAGKSRDNGGLGRLAMLAGALGGALPDFDFLLKPLADPALPFEFHRHLTHSLVFIPIGGLIAATPFLIASLGRRHFGTVLIASIAGCATHGLLDNMTSYGTHLFWPFISERTAWDSMSIIDPIFTGLLLLILLVALVRAGPSTSRAGFVLACLYMTFGFVQHARGVNLQQVIAEKREHTIERGRVMPTLGNVVVFRSLYIADGVMYADAIRIPPFRPATARQGESLRVLAESDLPHPIETRVREVISGLDAFASGFVAVDPKDRGDDRVYVGDMRLSIATSGFRPLWGVSLSTTGKPDPQWAAFGRREADPGELLGELLDDLFDRAGMFRPVMETK